MQFFIATAVEDKKGPTEQGATGPGGSTCTYPALFGKRLIFQALLCKSFPRFAMIPLHPERYLFGHL